MTQHTPLTQHIAFQLDYIVEYIATLKIVNVIIVDKAW